jgi:hypothetical protein
MLRVYMRMGECVFIRCVCESMCVRIGVNVYRLVCVCVSQCVMERQKESLFECECAHVCACVKVCVYV